MMTRFDNKTELAVSVLLQVCWAVQGCCLSRNLKSVSEKSHVVFTLPWWQLKQGEIWGNMQKNLHKLTSDSQKWFHPLPGTTCFICQGTFFLRTCDWVGEQNLKSINKCSYNTVGNFEFELQRLKFAERFCNNKIIKTGRQVFGRMVVTHCTAKVSATRKSNCFWRVNHCLLRLQNGPLSTKCASYTSEID